MYKNKNTPINVFSLCELFIKKETMNFDFFQNFFHPKWNGVLDVIGETYVTVTFSGLINASFCFEGDNPFVLWTFGIHIYSALIYWIGALFYLILDLIDKPKWIAKYKIQPGVNEPVDIGAVIKVSV